MSPVRSLDPADSGIIEDFKGYRLKWKMGPAKDQIRRPIYRLWAQERW